MDQVDQVDEISIQPDDLRRPIAVVRMAGSVSVGEGVWVELRERGEDVLDGRARLVDGLW